MKKLTKRFIVLFVCMTLIFMQQTTLLAFADEQNETFNDVVVSKLGTDEYTVEVLYGFSGQATHLLAEGENCYLIFDTARQQFTEYSKNGNSPFYGLPQASVKIYLAPTYNYYVLNGVYYELPNSTILDELEIQELCTVESEYRTLLNENCNQKQSQAYTTRDEEESEYLIEHGFYFENMTSNYGTNGGIYSDSCVYVALGMLLSYYDSFNNDNCIDESYDVSEVRYFDTFESIDLEEYLVSPGIHNGFHAAFIELGHARGYSDIDSNIVDTVFIVPLMKAYIEEEKGFDILAHAHGVTQDASFIIQGLDEDKPVLVRIETGVETKHVVVAYGYTSEGNIIVHYGYGYSTARTVISQDILLKGIYFDFEPEHVCSDNYIWYAEGCNGTICPCGQYTCDHQGLNILEYNSTNHKYRCAACNVIKATEQHTYVADGCLDICTVCGYTNIVNDNHTFVTNEIGLNICTICGYEDIANHNHTITYVSNNDRRTHNKVCVCGYVERQACVSQTFVGSNVQVCISCGQTLLSIIPPIIHNTNGTQVE